MWGLLLSDWAEEVEVVRSRFTAGHCAAGFPGMCALEPLAGLGVGGEPGF